MSLFLLPPVLGVSVPNIMLAADLLLAGKQQVCVPAEHHTTSALTEHPIIAGVGRQANTVGGCVMSGLSVLALRTLRRVCGAANNFAIRHSERAGERMDADPERVSCAHRMSILERSEPQPELCI